MGENVSAHQAVGDHGFLREERQREVRRFKSDLRGGKVGM